MCSCAMPDGGRVRALAAHWRCDRFVQQRGVNTDAEAAVWQIFEFDTFVAPDRLDAAHGRPARFGFALLQLVNGSLGKPNAKRQVALAPAKDRPRHSNS